MELPIPNSSSKKRYAIFECPTCKNGFRTYVNDVRIGKSNGCKKCKATKQSITLLNLNSNTKKCGTCNNVMPLASFYNSKLSKDGKGNRCKHCDSLARIAWSTKNPIKQKESTRRRNLIFKYGITLEEYDTLLMKQNNKCACCETSSNPERNFSVDHCHITGEVRGLLCSECNRGIGMLGDTAESVKKAYDYLLSWAECH